MTSPLNHIRSPKMWRARAQHIYSLILWHQQKLIFIGGGCLTALIDVGVMQGLIEMRLSPLMAASAGFFTSLLFSYVFHAKLTFQSAAMSFSFARYMCVIGVNYLLTISFIAAGMALTGAALPGKLVVLPVVAVISFLLNKYWTFK